MAAAERSTFLVGSTPKQDIAMRREVDVVALKSLRDITAAKMLLLSSSINEEEEVSRKLKSNFVPQRPTEKRRTHPIFHSDARPSSPKCPRDQQPNVLPYNPLDKSIVSGSPEPTKKLPFSKAKKVAISDMKKPHTSTVGVVPHPRLSSELPELKIIMQGQTPLPVDAAEFTARSATMDACMHMESSSQLIEEAGKPALSSGPVDAMPQKPAILTKIGTSQPVVFSERQRPTVKQPTLVPMTRQRPARVNKVLKNLDPIYPEPTMSGLQDGDDNSDRPHSSSSKSSIRSVRELLEEAKEISNGGIRLHKPRAAYQSAASPDSAGKKRHGEHGLDKEDAAGAPVVRTVDQIIQALKVQKTSDVMPLTDADRKIQDIMNRVMQNANSVLADIGHEAAAADEQAHDKEGGDQMSDPLATDEGLDKTMATETVEGLDADDVSREAQNAGDLAAPEAPTISLIPPSPEVATAPTTAGSGKRHSFEPAAVTTSSGAQSRLSSYLPSVLGKESHASSDGCEESDAFDVKQAYKDLVASLTVRHEDIVSVNGRREPFSHKSQLDWRARKQLGAKAVPVHSNVTSFVSSFAPPSEIFPHVPSANGHVTSALEEHGTHYFCSLKTCVRLPRDLASVVRLSHVPDAYRRLKRLTVNTLESSKQTWVSSFSVDIEQELSEKIADWQRQTSAAERILKEASVLGDSDYDAWQHRAAELFDNLASIQVVGTKASIIDDESRLFWNPAPPKMGMHPTEVRRHLFPKYFGASLGDEGRTSMFEEIGEDEDGDSDSDGNFTANTYDKDLTNRILARRHHSSQDLTLLLKQQATATERPSKTPARGKSQEHSARSTSQEREKRLLRLSKEPASSVIVVQKRWRSLELLRDDQEPFVSVPEDYASAMAELADQRMRLRLAAAAAAATQGVAEDLMATQDQALGADKDAEDEIEQSLSNLPSEQRLERKRRTVPTTKPTLAEIALQSGRNYVVYKPKQKKAAQKVADMKRIEDIENFLYQKPNRLERHMSVSTLDKGTVDRSLRVPQHVRAQRRSSLPCVLEERELHEKHPRQDDTAYYDYIRKIWDDWFEEVFPLPKEESRSESVAEDKSEAENSEMAKDTAPAEKEEPALTDAEFARIETLEPLDQTDEGSALREVLEEEVLKMTDKINKSTRRLPFDLCRRGALLRKLGQVVRAKQDLDEAIAAEPMLVHAYWQRHLLCLLQGKKTDALDDLNAIIKVNRNHVGAYVSRAEILVQKDPTIAITNLTQALKIDPTNSDVYMKRATMYEQRGQVLLAMEDYAKAYKLNPRLTIAIFKRGRYYFDHNSWQPAINDFTEVLKKEPGNAAARLFRGRCFTKLGQWQQAVQDLSASVHYNPNGWEAYYWRGCAFRKCNPRQALLDYSVSILINDAEDNIKALLHRGILYDAMGRPEDAIPDFEAILKLRKDVAVAHLNLGLIYLTKMQWYPKAIKKFTAAISCDPTFVRAYVCRAEAYWELREYKNALVDYTRAIHLKPNVPHYYMHRGELLLKSGRTDLAAFCVRHVSELFADSDLGQSATQQAVVHSFLKNYQKAIAALSTTLKSNPTSAVYVLLGKTQMMAKMWQNASGSFQCALDLMKPWKPKDKWPKEAAEVNHLVGMCCMELRNYLGAHDAFNNAIDIDRKYAEALYQRGVAKLRLKQPKGVQDVNRALALDPKIFQAYLTRASYYGMRGQISKAILNCNEAVRLKPRSVRAYLYRGALKCHLRAYELAIKDLTTATVIDTQCALAYFNRAVCYHESGQYQRALADYSVVLLLGDQLVLKVLINRGLLYLSHTDYQNALYDFLLAAKVNTYDPKIRHTLGLCMHKLKRLKEAVLIFTETLKIDQHFIEAYVSRGNAYLDYGSEAGFRAAMCDYQRALVLRSNFLPARINMAYGLQSRGKLQQAWRQFTIALEMDGRCSAAFEGRAVVNLQAGNLFAALQDINMSLGLRPSAELHNNRGVINQFMQDHVGAMHDFQMAIKLDPTYALSYFNAGNMYFAMRQFKQAKLYYDQAVQFNEKDESALVNRAIAKAMLKDAAGALQDFEAAMLLSPRFAHIYFNRGNLHASQGQYEAAERDYAKALELQPDDALVYKKRADALGKMGRREAAVQNYRRAVELQARVEHLRKLQPVKM